MIINVNTKIGNILKGNPGALDAIVSLSPKFEKLRNPLLRKVIAGRTSISMASKIAGVQVTDFFNKLQPLGFEIDTATLPVIEEKTALPQFISKLTIAQIIDFDVRELLASGKDPLSLILEKIKSVKPGEALKVINTFEPVPLIKMLEKQGFDVYADNMSSDLVETYFYKNSDNAPIDIAPKADAKAGFDEMLQRFSNKLITIDVRELEMPQPMLTILAELEKLPEDTALFVNHKRIPVFLLPELSDRNLDYRIQEINEGNVHLLIFRN